MTSAQTDFSDLAGQILYKIILTKLAKKLAEDGIPVDITINGSDESKDKILEHFKSILGLENVTSSGSKRPNLTSLNKKGGRTPKKGSPKHVYLEPEEYLKKVEEDPETILCSHVPVRGQNKNKVCCKPATDDYTINNLDARCKDCLNSDGKPKAGNGKTVFGDLKPSDAHANEIPDFNTTEKEPVAAALSGNVKGATSPTNLVVPEDEEAGGGEAPAKEEDEEVDDLENFLSSIPVTNSPNKD